MNYGIEINDSLQNTTLIEIRRNLIALNSLIGIGLELKQWLFYTGLDVNLGYTFNNTVHHTVKYLEYNEDSYDWESYSTTSHIYKAYSSLYGSILAPVGVDFTCLNKRLSLFGEQAVGYVFEILPAINSTHGSLKFCIRLGAKLNI